MLALPGRRPVPLQEEDAGALSGDDLHRDYS